MPSRTAPPPTARAVADCRLTRGARPACVVEPLEGRALLAAGGLDPTFGAGGIAVIGPLSTGDSAGAAVQADGRTVIVSGLRGPGGDSDFAVARVLPGGTPDRSFGVDGVATARFDLGGDNNDVASGVAIQADGKIVVVGSAQRSIRDQRGRPIDFDVAVARFLPDGTPDASFGVGGKASVDFDPPGSSPDFAVGMAIQADGRIVVAVDTPGGFGVARLNADGVPDPGFGDRGRAIIDFDPGGVNHGRATGVAIQDDGRIVVVGSVYRLDTFDDFGLARLNADGTPDASFGAGGRVTLDFGAPGRDPTTDFATGVAIQPDGRIVVAGSTSRYDAALLAPTSDFAVARLAADGTLDASFGAGGRKTVGFDLGAANNDAATGVAIQPDGRIVVVGTAERPRVDAIVPTDIGVVRLNADGTPDASFGAGGKTSLTLVDAPGYSTPTGVAIQPDGRIVVAGSGKVPGVDSRIALVRLEASKPPDPPEVGPLPDRTPPQLLGAVPIFVGQGRRRRVAGFALAFDEAIDPATVGAGRFRLAVVRRIHRGKVLTTPVRIAGSSYDPATRTVTIRQAGKAGFPRGARIAVRPGVTDPAGNALDAGPFGVAGQTAVIITRRA